MLQTQFLGSPYLPIATGAIRRLASVHLRAWGGCLASISRGEPRRLLDRTGVTALVFTALSSVTSPVSPGFRMSTCTRALMWPTFAYSRIFLFGLSHSLTLHGLLRDYGPNQRERWRHTRFAIVITQRLLQEVQHELIGALPG